MEWSSSGERDSPKRLGLLFCFALAVVIGGVGYVTFAHLERSIRQTKAAELTAIATLKTREVAGWLTERWATAELIKGSPSLAETAGRWYLTGEEVARLKLLARLEQWRTACNCRSLMLLTDHGELSLAVGEAPPEVSPRLRELALAARQSKQIQFSDIQRDQDTATHLHIDYVIPLLGEQAEATQPIAILVMRYDPYTSLFPLLQSWPVPSASSETLLVRREGDEVVYLSPVRHRTDPALTLRLPLSRRDLPPVQAILNPAQQDVFEGVDYRGVPVLAAVRLVPGAPWMTVAKTDRDEIFGAVSAARWVILALLLIAIGVVGIMISALWHQRILRYERRSREQALEHQALVKHFDYLSKFANDIILLADEEYRILEVNDRALAAYGWSRQELLGMPAVKLRAPATRQDFARDHNRLEREDSALFETCHRRRDGTEFPVEVSARLVVVAGKRYYQDIIRDITERKRHETQLAEAENFARATLDALSAHLCVIDASGTILRVNRAWRAFAAVNEADLPAVAEQRNYLQVCDTARGPCSAEARPFAEGIRAVLRGERAEFTLEYPCHSPTEPRWFLGKVTPFPSSGPARAVIAHENITARKQMEQALRDSEARYRARSAELELLVDAIPTPVWIADDPDCRHIRGNRAAAELLGMAVDANLSATPPRDQPVPSYQVRSKGQVVSARELPMQRAAATGRPVRDCELELVRADGQTRWAYGGAVPLFSDSGQVRGCLGAFVDITTRKRVEEALRASEERLRLALESGRMGTWVWELGTDRITWDAREYELFGIEPITGRPAPSERFFMLIHPQDRARVRRAAAALLAGPDRWDEEFRIVLPTGQIRWIGGRGELGRDAAGQPLRFIGVNFEITERKQAEETLRASAAQLAETQRIASLGSWESDETTHRQAWSDETYRLLGYEPRAFEPTTGVFLSRVHPTDRERVRNAIARAWERAEACDITFRIVSPSGEERVLHLQGEVIRADAGHTIGMRGAVQDITERTRIEAQLREHERQLIQAAKLAALGTLVSGVAHEINNPNNLILLNAQLLAEAWVDLIALVDDHKAAAEDLLVGGLPYPEMRKMLPLLIHDIQQGALRIQRIVADLKDFVRPGAITTGAELNLNATIQRALNLLSHTIKQKTDHLQVNLPEDLPLLLGNAQQFEQVVVNLVLNALEALPDKTRAVILSTRWDSEDNCIELRVEDEGTGIAPENLNRLCEPFFTTKQDQQGIGLGLFIAYKLITAHGGTLTFESEPGRGTVALVRLPLPVSPPKPPTD